MEQEYGKEMTTALDKYIGVVSLTKPQAKEILQAVYPEAPGDEIARAVLLCASYGLNPLMKHVFLIPFNKGKSNETWATVIGIKAKRLLASRRGNYSYVDNTPRVMTEAEQKGIFGEVYGDKVMVITKVKDPATGAEAPGYGAWPKNTEPYGTEKGNSKFNMAAIRSESQALDRLRPGEMPVGVEVVSEEVAEAAIEAEYREVKEEAAKIKEGLDYQAEHMEHRCEEHNCKYEPMTGRYGPFYGHKKADGKLCVEGKKKDAKAKPQASIEPSEVPTLEPKSEPEPEEPQQLKRDPESIRTLNELYKACNEGWGMQPAQVVSELGVSSQSDIADTPADCYRKIASVR